MVRQKLFILVACIYILAITCTLWTSYLLISPTFYPILVLCVCALCYPADLMRNSFFRVALFYCFVLFLIPSIHKLSAASFSYGSGDYVTALIESAFILPSVAISAIIYEHKDRKEVKYIAFTGIVAVVISLFFMIPTIIVDNSAIRMYSEHVNADMRIDASQMAVARLFWNYPMCHAIALLFPAYIALYRFAQNKRDRILFLALVLAVFIFIIQSSIATTIFFSLICLVFAYNERIERNKLFVYVCEFVILGLLYFALPSIINLASDFFEGGAMEGKIQDLSSLLQGREDENGSFSVRSERHRQAWECFWNSPFWGDFLPVNGHSVFLNRLASLGLLGIIPFCLIFTKFFYNYKFMFGDRLKMYYYLAFTCTTVIIYIKGVLGQEGYITIFVLVPTTLLWLQNR